MSMGLQSACARAFFLARHVCMLMKIQLLHCHGRTLNTLPQKCSYSSTCQQCIRQKLIWTLALHASLIEQHCQYIYRHASVCIEQHRTALVIFADAIKQVKNWVPELYGMSISALVCYNILRHFWLLFCGWKHCCICLQKLGHQALPPAVNCWETCSITLVIQHVRRAQPITSFGSTEDVYPLRCCRWMSQHC